MPGADETGMGDVERARWWSERSPYLVMVRDPQERRHFAPAAARNCGPILDVLGRHLPQAGTILEIGSGTGQHIVAFAQAHPGLIWQPSDPDPLARESIAAWIATSGLGNVRPPLDLNVMQAGWEVPLGWLQGIVCINLLHIAPWAASVGLMAGAGRALEAGAPLYIYGAFKRGGRHTSESNAWFDRSLRHRDPAWGLRDVEAVEECAAAHGLEFVEVVSMPANNLSLIFRRR